MHFFESRTIVLVFGGILQLSCLVSCLPKPCPKFDVPYGRTKYRSRGRVIRITCLKGYNLIGESRTLLCTKGKWDSEIPICAKPGCTLPEARIPNGKVMSSYNHQMIRTECEEGFEMQGSPVIFCNGIVWNDTLPLCLGKPGIKACDFEGRDQFCGWYQTRSFLGWQIGHDPLENWVSYWAPDFDHTFGLSSFGHYIHLKARSELTPYPATGQLKSPVYRKPDNPHVCFQFWFHVFGEETAGDLKVFVNRELVWSKLQVNRKLWQRGAFHFVANSTYQILIEATIPSNMVTVALDDLEVMENCTKVTDYVVGTASTCEGRCGDDGYVDDCSCDYGCQDVDNCCPDFAYFCPTMANDTTVVTETSMVSTQNYVTAITTLFPLYERETVPFTSVTESYMDQNTVNENLHQQAEEIENQTSGHIAMEENQEDNNIEKINEQVNLKARNDTFNKQVDAESPNETMSEQVAETTQASSMGPDTTLNVDMEKTINAINNHSSIVQNISSKEKHENENKPNTNQIDVLESNGNVEDKNYNITTMENDGSVLGFNESSYQNVRTKENRIKGSIKKSTVVFEDESDQSHKNRTQTDTTKTGTSIVNSTDDISHDQVLKSTEVNMSENQNETVKYNVEKTTSEPGNDSSRNHGNTETRQSNTTTTILLHAKLNSTDAEKATTVNSDRENTTTFTLNNTKNNTAEGDGMTVCENNAPPINTASNVTNENSSSNSSQSNRNITKITLYQNSTAANANNTQHTNSISRVQIQMNVQPNGKPLIENVKIDEMGKYNESTIARLKQINAHIINVIAKRNGSSDENTTSSNVANNSTVLHKLKHFITTIIDNHNKSSLLTNNTENIDKKYNLNSLVDENSMEHTVEMSRNVNSSILKTTYYSNSTDSIGSDGLLILSEKPPASQSIQQTTNLTLPTQEDIKETKTLRESSDSIANKSSSAIKPILNMTVFNTNGDISNKTVIESLDYKIFDLSQNKTYLGPGKQERSDNGTSPDEVSNTKDSEKLKYWGNFSKQGQNTSQGEDINSRNTTSTTFTPKTISQTQSTSKYFPVTIRKSKVGATTQRFRIPSMKAKLDEALKKINSSLSKMRPVNQTSTLRRVTTPYNRSKWFWRRVTTIGTLSTSTSRSTNQTTPSETNTEQTTSTTRSGASRYSISLLKNAFEKSNTDFTSDTQQKYRYNIAEETTNTMKNEKIVIQASPSKIDEMISSSQASSYSPLNIVSILLIIASVLLSTVASFCLVRRYRRVRGDDTEIEYLTGDELLYFHTPSPHLRSHRSQSSESGDDMRTF